MESTKALIIKELEANGDWIFSGKLARIIHEITGTKESVVERKARELRKAGVLEVVYEQVEDQGPKCAKYRIAQVEVPIKGIVDSKTERVIYQKELI